ncbi:uroporphyrinogen-III synthase [Arthrobacter sp. NPDC058288]|uniref:uroporphyrinogen-III synthase n=1 Tax=Arthrobacter sp. NPDC058288 TaxID=3346424 RepID=UPI0036EADD59
MMGRRSARGEGPHGLRVLEGARVLVTRSPDRAGVLLAALRETGAEPLLLPLIDFERARDLHSLEVAFDALGAGAYTWLVISSVTTVQALEELARERGSTLSRWLPGSVQVATIGPATRRELELRGITVDLAPARLQSGVGLLDIWPRGQGSVFLPQADIADSRLAEGLESLGARVQAVTAYHTVDYPADPARSFSPEPASAVVQAGTEVLTPAEAKAELDAGRLHAVVAASPSAARRIHAGLSPLGECRFVAIGRSTAAEAKSLGLPVAAVAEEPTTSGLVSAVIQALAPGHSTPPPATETYVKDRT